MTSLECNAVWLLQEPTIRRNVSLHHQGDKNGRFRNVSSNKQPTHAAKKYLRSTERRLFQEPHDLTFKKTSYFIVTAVKT
jgi:hypothetical protein